MNHPTKRGKESGAAGGGGFSLLETVIAVAITVTALTVVMGLLALALGAIRDSKADSVAVFIAQDYKSRAIAGDLEDRPLTGNFIPAASDTKVLYYDAEGSPLFDDNGASPADAAAARTNYRAEVTLIDPTTLPADTPANYGSPRLDLLLLKIFRNDGSQTPAASFTLQRSHQIPRHADPRQ